MTPTAQSSSVLLVEPQFVMRRTMVAVAREMGLVDLQEATSVARALPLLSTRSFRGLVLDMGDGPEALDLLHKLRAGSLASQPQIPVIALTSEPTPALRAGLDAMKPLRTLHKPFKVGELIYCVSMMGPR